MRRNRIDCDTGHKNAENRTKCILFTNYPVTYRSGTALRSILNNEYGTLICKNVLQICCRSKEIPVAPPGSRFPAFTKTFTFTAYKTEATITISESFMSLRISSLWYNSSPIFFSSRIAESGTSSSLSSSYCRMYLWYECGIVLYYFPVCIYTDD